MPLTTESVDFAGMAKPGAATKQVNVRLPRELVDGIDRWRNGHELQPTWTQVVEAAVREYAAKRQIPLTAGAGGKSKGKP